MSLSNDIKRILIIQDASNDLSTISVRHVLQILKLKHGDKLKLLGIIQAFTKNSRSNPGCSLIFKEKCRLHSSATINKHNKDIKEEAEKTMNQYLSSVGYREILEITEQLQVKFEIAIEVGMLNEVAVEYAKVYHATQVILHRKLKKEVKYFTHNLPCGISRMKLDYTIEVIRPTKSDAQEIAWNPDFRGNDHDSLKNSSCSLCVNTRPRAGETKIFTFADLQQATNEFSQQKLMPDYGKKVYFGILNDHRRCLIREQPSNSTIKEEDFRREVCILEKVGYENVALLLGYCTEGLRRFIVYEYICNGSLGTHLSRKPHMLTWDRRINIALGAAKGLENLHRRSVYGSMRPNNIIITHDFQPFISFYGLATNQYEALGHTSDTTVLKTFEYISPEYDETGIDLSKADVYSFGVVLLELITGRKTIEDTYGQSFLRWARPLLQKKKYMELIDPAIQSTADLQQLYWLVRVVERCLNWDPNSRYPMIRVVKALWDIINQSGMRDFSPTEF